MGIEHFRSSQRVLDETMGFLSAQVTRKIIIAYPTTTTETYSHQTGSTVHFVLTVTYTDATKANVSSIERTT